MNNSVKVKIIWLTVDEGGRKSPPPMCGFYYPMTSLPNEPNAWSLAIDIIQTLKEQERWVSEGSLQFLVEQAPHHLLKILDIIEIYEWPKKVASAFIQSTQ
ncbi:hypothetical protein [Proteus hauseri]|uniref:hypothetical protein n=1 Tax=Proteus hauseri TaxID=183417 RepID=UPI0010097609|nr:hypothetical protein [Proteus hauseri]QAV24151.1 hypothetical protein PH4a_12725 [Proteus hauseri]